MLFGPKSLYSINIALSAFVLCADGEQIAFLSVYSSPGVPRCASQGGMHFFAL